MSTRDESRLDAGSPTLFLTDDDVGQLADWRATFDALRNAYAAPIAAAMVPPRSMARGDRLWLRGLTAVSPSGRYMGCKLIAASMKAKRASYLISLFDQDSMELSALIDANRITGIRTAATSVVAIDAAAPRRPLQVGLIGAGFEARGVLSALAAIRSIASVRIFSPTPASRERLAAHFRAVHSLQAEAVGSAPEAVSGADVVVCATRSHDETPVLLGQWLEPGMTVVSIGSTLPEQREVDEHVIARATVIVADVPEEVTHETGDMQQASRAGVMFADKLVSLSDYLKASAPRDIGDIVLYKSVGSALQDIITAEMLLARARTRGLGTPMPRSIVPVSK